MRALAASLGVALVLGCAPLARQPGAVAPGSNVLARAEAGITAKPEAVLPGLSAEQQKSLRAGHTVEQRVVLKRHGRRYVGGVSYMLLRAEPKRIFDLLNHLPTLTKVLPRTRRTHVIDRQQNQVRVELEQGNSMVSTTYTVYFALDVPEGGVEGHTVRFWLDPSRPHGIEDVWGFFRTTRFDSEHALVAVGAMVDLGQGVLQMLFEGRIQRSILRLPHRIRDQLGSPPSAGSRLATHAKSALQLGDEPRQAEP